MNNERDCEHGQLKRSCEICEYEREIAELRAENAKLRSVHACADTVCAIIGANGSIESRDTEVIALLEALCAVDELMGSVK